MRAAVGMQSRQETGLMRQRSRAEPSSAHCHAARAAAGAAPRSLAAVPCPRRCSLHIAAAFPHDSSGTDSSSSSSSGIICEPISAASSSSAVREPAWLPRVSRRAAVALPPLLTAAVAAQLGAAPPSHASKLGGAVDSAWEAMGGGPADLFFPDPFVGTWDAVSTLVKVETPLGEEAVPNKAALQRARDADLNKPVGYQVGFMRNRSGRVIFDRRFNIASMVAQYYPEDSAADLAGRIQWSPEDPNVLQLRMPRGGLDIRTRVTRRSQEDKTAERRIETSEYMEQVFESGGTTRVKASQCFTKYL